jgi:YD repeat-containing protein
MVYGNIWQLVRRARFRPVALLALAALGMAGLSDMDASAANGTATYTYDALGRISSVTYDTGAIVYYSYDANGNRLSQVVNVNAAGLTWSLATSPCTTNCWGGALWHAGP